MGGEKEFFSRIFLVLLKETFPVNKNKQIVHQNRLLVKSNARAHQKDHLLSLLLFCGLMLEKTFSCFCGALMGFNSCVVAGQHTSPPTLPPSEMRVCIEGLKGSL